MAVDLLVNNTGFGNWGNFLDESRETYAEMVDLNIRAVAELCHVFLPAMAARGDCGILNVGSTGLSHRSRGRRCTARPRRSCSRSRRRFPTSTVIAGSRSPRARGCVV